jgi:glyceraldehyde-3-phosphate dehydrogenase (NADP+)
MEEPNYGQQASLFGKDIKTIALIDTLVNLVCRNLISARDPGYLVHLQGVKTGCGNLSIHDDALRSF